MNARLPTTEMEPLERMTLGDRAYRQIADLLIAGRLAPGERMSLRSTAEALGVSMMPIREAVTRLVGKDEDHAFVRTEALAHHQALRAGRAVSRDLGLDQVHAGLDVDLLESGIGRHPFAGTLCVRMADGATACEQKGRKHKGGKYRVNPCGSVAVAMRARRAQFEKRCHERSVRSVVRFSIHDSCKFFARLTPQVCGDQGALPGQGEAVV